jgi:hypothetical protein
VVVGALGFSRFGAGALVFSKEAPDVLQDLADPLALDLGILTQQPVDLILERIELRPPRPPRIARRRRRTQRPPDRLAMQPRPTTDLPDPQPLDEPHPTNLGPLLHADHPSSPGTVDDDQARLSSHPDSTERLPGWSSFQPA